MFLILDWLRKGDLILKSIIKFWEDRQDGFCACAQKMIHFSLWGPYTFQTGRRKSRGAKRQSGTCSANEVSGDKSSADLSHADREPQGRASPPMFGKIPWPQGVLRYTSQSASRARPRTETPLREAAENLEVWS